MTKIILLNANLSSINLDQYLTHLSAARREKAQSYHNMQDKNASICASLLVRYLMNSEFGIENNTQEYAVSKHGKPYLVDHPNIHFNISHSGDYIACAIDSSPIGVDIEQVRNYRESIPKKFFTASEIKYLENCVDETESFYKLWTIKEAYIKYLGTGLYKPLNTFSIQIDDTIFIHDEDTSIDTSNLCIHTSAIHPDYYLASIGHSDFEIQTWSYDNFIQNLDKEL